MPLVSIIIPLHNRESIIHATLKSVLQQTYENWECIIVDDHSTDSSYDVAKEWEKKDARFMVYRLPDSKRYGNAARNYGVTKAKGEYLNFLDSDDLLEPSKLEKQMDEFLRFPELDIVTCLNLFFNNSDKKLLPIPLFSKEKSWIYASLNKTKGGLTWVSASPIWKKSFLLNNGLWDESLLVWQDLEINIRAIVNKGNIKRLDDFLVFVAVDANGSLSALQPEISRPLVLDALLKIWNYLQINNQINSSIKHIILNRIFLICIQQKNIYKGIKTFISSSKIIKLENKYYLLFFMVIFVRLFSYYRSKKLIGSTLNIDNYFEFLQTNFSINTHDKQEMIYYFFDLKNLLSFNEL